MRNVARLAESDFRRLFSNTVSVIIVLGLVLLPSIFTWYNVLACWDVFGNTGNVKVAVANSDEGYQSDLFPLKVRIGDEVVSALRENDQLDWVFTSEDEAIDGVAAGRYYAAVVLPESFSRDMLTFYSGDGGHAQLEYYSNEKKNAIAPKVTEQGADQVSAQVNRAFAETLSESALGIAQSLAGYLDDADAEGALGQLVQVVGDAGERLTLSSRALDLQTEVVGSVRALAQSSGDLLTQAGALSDETFASTGQARDAVGAAQEGMQDAGSALSEALRQSASGFASVPAAIDQAFDSASTTAGEGAASLRSMADAAQRQQEAYRSVVSKLRETAATLDPGARSVVEGFADSLDAAADAAGQSASSLSDAAASLDAHVEDATGAHDEAKRIAQQAQEGIEAVSSDYESSVAPVVEQLSEDLDAVTSLLPEVSEALDNAGAGASEAVSSASARLESAEQALASAADELASSGTQLTDLSARMAQALGSGDAEALRQVIGQDPATLAQVLSAPVQLDRQAVYPVENFGSAMAPLYTSLALWIGSLLIMIAIKPSPDPRALAELSHPTPRQLFLGRFAVVAALSVLQSTCIGLGNLLFLGVQADNPVLYLLCLWVTGLVFAFIVYTLVASFGNAGKVLSVVLLVIQVSGGGGSYPLALLPDFFQAVSPFLPVTHAVNAMRAAMFGVYQGDFWVELGVLALFLVPFLVIGLVLRNPLIKVIGSFTEKTESTKVM